MDKGLVGGSSMLLVLSLLTEKDMYGYEMIRALDERSDSTFQYREGTLYPILHKLENKGFVTSYKEKTQQGKERKYYSITAKGQEQFAEESRQWQVFSNAVNKVVYGKGGVIWTEENLSPEF